MSNTVEGLTHRGVGRLNDGTFVPRVLPGEVVEIGDDGTARILEPSTDRVKPNCQHFKTCGGCSLMHASDYFVAQWKTNVVTSALSAHRMNTDVRPIYTSPAQSRRRAKFSGRRTKKGTLIGFHGRASDMLVDVTGCQLVDPQILTARPIMQELTLIAASRRSEAQFTVTQSQSGLDIAVQTEKPITDQLRLDLAGLAQKHQLARLAWNDEIVVTLREPIQNFGPASVSPPPGAFLQATLDGENEMVSIVRDIVGDASRIIDFFSGCGTFSLPMAITAEVHAIESEADMLDALDRGWRAADGLKKVTTETRDLFRRPFEPEEIKGFDAVVLDPPRAGAAAQVDRLVHTDIRKIAMVSCNPVTFARDAKTLVDGRYSLDFITPIDQFRWSSHIEIVGSFTRM